MNYNLIVVAKAAAQPEKVEEHLKAILEKEGFIISDFLAWGKKQLAYKIKQSTEGLYYSMVIASPTAKPQQVYTRFKLEEDILRSLVTKKVEIKHKAKKEAPKGDK
jgi:ribosomal protein S6